MRIPVLALGLVWAASLFGQHRFRWQDYCFNNPGAPVCRGNDYAIKPPARGKDATRGSVATNPIPSAPQTARPSVIVLGKIDWRFADPFADGLAWFDFSGLAASPLARSLIGQLAGTQGLFDGLTGVDQVALSVRNARVVVMVTGGVTDSALAAAEPGFKAVQAGNGMLLGHTDAVDEAIRRIATARPPTELTRLAGERQAGSEFWAIGSGRLIGPQMKGFLVTASIRNRLTSDVALEFNEVPSADAIRMLQSKAGAATLEGNTVHLRMSMETDEVQQKFGQIVASPEGQRLAAALVEAARHLPARDTTVPKQTRPVIYGLDGGPRVVGQDPQR
jgi:hypothetical protein